MPPGVAASPKHQEHEGRALEPLTRVVEVGADDHVSVAVAVDVPGVRDRES